jgi:hypothetical protein
MMWPFSLIEELGNLPPLITYATTSSTTKDGAISPEDRRAVVKLRLRRAREQAARIPELERELAELTKKGPTP